MIIILKSRRVDLRSFFRICKFLAQMQVFYSQLGHHVFRLFDEFFVSTSALELRFCFISKSPFDAIFEMIIEYHPREMLFAKLAFSFWSLRAHLHVDYVCFVAIRLLKFFEWERMTVTWPRELVNKQKQADGQGFIPEL